MLICELLIYCFSLRQYYLVQVLWVDGVQPSSQPGHHPSSPKPMRVIVIYAYKYFS
jgi:hypothetical protein